MNFKYIILLFFSFLTASSFSQYITLHDKGPVTPYSPTGRPRMAAEWEPAIGVLVTWPLSIPHTLLIELAKDIRLYVLVDSKTEQKEAVNWLTKWKIRPDKVKLIPAPQGIDAPWTRDWGPHAVFTVDGTMKLADPKYLYSTPVTGLTCADSLHFLFYDDNNQIILTKKDDQMAHYISMYTGYDIVNLPFVFTGGNVISDGQRTGFSTCVITNENRYANVPDEKFLNDVHQLLGLDHYNIISNFELEGIQHIDCFMKLLDEERMLVTRPPVDHPLYEQYEGIVINELSYLKNAYGRPYQILRLDTDRYQGDELAAYANSLILNKVVYVPLFGIGQDSVALKQWGDAMPGYKVKGFTFKMKDEPTLSEFARNHYEDIGWNAGDALHCRTRAIWDPEMVYISVDREPYISNKDESYVFRAIVKDYSGKGIIPERLKLFWRKQGEKGWRESQMTKTEIEDHFTGQIDRGAHKTTIEFYISAESNSGRKETMPRVAPDGFYKYKNK